MKRNVCATSESFPRDDVANSACQKASCVKVFEFSMRSQKFSKVSGLKGLSHILDVVHRKTVAQQNSSGLTVFRCTASNM